MTALERAGSFSSTALSAAAGSRFTPSVAAVAPRKASVMPASQSIERRYPTYGQLIGDVWLDTANPAWDRCDVCAPRSAPRVNRGQGREVGPFGAGDQPAPSPR